MSTIIIYAVAAIVMRLPPRTHEGMTMDFLADYFGTEKIRTKNQFASHAHSEQPKRRVFLTCRRRSNGICNALQPLLCIIATSSAEERDAI